jgi:hypothetical protein
VHRFPEYIEQRGFEENMHTLFTWGEAVCKYYDTLWVGNYVLDTVLAIGDTELGGIDLNQFDWILMDSWCESGCDFLWKALMDYKGLFSMFIHFPNGVNFEDASWEDRIKLAERYQRIDVAFQTAQLQQEYYEILGNTKCFPDIVWPVPTNMLYRQAGQKQKSEYPLATPVHTFDGFGQSFRPYATLKWLENMGFAVKVTTKQQENTEKLNDHLKALGYERTECVGWLGGDYGRFLSTCWIMAELAIHPSISSAVCRAVASNIPCVSTGGHPFQKALYPDLAVQNAHEAQELILKLRDDSGFEKEQTNKAKELMEECSIDNMARKIYETIEEELENARK